MLLGPQPGTGPHTWQEATSELCLQKTREVVFSGSPVAKTPRFQCRRHEFDPWLGNYDPICDRVGLKKKKKTHEICSKLLLTRAAEKFHFE